jgi:diguanylate cyclase (GGDEF)-like protein
MLVRGFLLELAELVTAWPFLVLLAANFSTAPALVALATASALATIAFATWTLTSERSPVERERQTQLLDPLTGALSRVAFEAALAREQERVLRGERSAGLLVCDLDHFGRFNERYGHLGGDRALRFAVEQIQAAARAGDLVARWGGEEICLITPGIGSLAELEELCERVRLAVGGGSLAVEGERVSLTISIGATLLTDWSTPEATFARADEALYLAKRTRDAVCVLAPKLPGGERTAWALASAEPVPSSDASSRDRERRSGGSSLVARHPTCDQYGPAGIDLTIRPCKGELTVDPRDDSSAGQEVRCVGALRRVE